MTVKTFRGSPALSEFRLTQLQQKCQQYQLPITSVYAEYLHFVEQKTSLGEDEIVKLQALLHYGSMFLKSSLQDIV